MTIQVYVGTYAKYNSGSIAGAWLDLEDYSDHDEFIEACKELHKDEADPELMFQDYEGFPESFYCECSISADLWDWLELDEDDREMLDAYITCFGSGTIEQARDAFQGTAKNELDYTYQWVDDVGLLADMPDNLKGYFDYEAFSRDLFMTDLCFMDGHVFSNY